MSMPSRENEDNLLPALRTGRRYPRTIRLALLGLLAGGGLLAGARVLRLLGISDALTISSTLAELLGWFFLGSSTVILWPLKAEEPRIPLRDSVGERRGRAGRALHLERSREDAIDSLYAELRPLMSRAVSDPGLREEVEAKLSRLHELQSEEADEMQKRFEAGLLLKPGEGWQALDRANELLARYADSSSSNPPSEHQR
jgi:hypothetical protein